MNLSSPFWLTACQAFEFPGTAFEAFYIYALLFSFLFTQRPFGISHIDTPSVVMSLGSLGLVSIDLSCNDSTIMTPQGRD